MSQRKVIRVQGVYSDLAGVFGPAVVISDLEKQIASFTRPDGRSLVSVWLDGNPDKWFCSQEENPFDLSIAWRDRTKGYYFTPQSQTFLSPGPEISGQRTINVSSAGGGLVPRVPAGQLSIEGNPLDNNQGTFLFRAALETTSDTNPRCIASGEEATSSTQGLGYFTGTGSVTGAGAFATAIGGTVISDNSIDYRDHVLRTYGVSWAVDFGVSLIVNGNFVATRDAVFSTPSWGNLCLFGRGAQTGTSQVLNGDFARVLLLSDDIRKPIYDDIREVIYQYMSE